MVRISCSVGANGGCVIQLHMNVCVWALEVNCGWRMQRGCALKSTGSWQELTEIQRRESDWCERLRGAEKKVKESFQEPVRKVRSGLYGRKWWDKHYRRISLNRNGKIWRYSETESNNGKIKKKGNRWKMQREIMGSEKMAAEGKLEANVFSVLEC